MNGKRRKITVSVNENLLGAIEAALRSSPGHTLDCVFDEALFLWSLYQVDSFDSAYYKENGPSLEDPAWSSITTESARRIWAS